MSISDDRIRAGFAALLEVLRANSAPSPSDRVKANSKAREVAGNRVWNEYGALGLMPPSDIALSITALRALGYAAPEPANMPAEEAAE